MSPPRPEAPVDVLVGGVSQLYQGDLDLGRIAVERLAAAPLPTGAVVEEFHYGAVAVAQRLQDVQPRTLVLVGAAARGYPPGSVHRRRVRGPTPTVDQAQRAIADAVTGYVAIDLVLEVAAGLQALPAHTVTVEVEPAGTEPGQGLTAEAEAGLDTLLDITRAEIRRAPLLEVAERLRGRDEPGRLAPAPALDVQRALLRELTCLEDEGHWGATFALRDRLRRHIAEGRTADGMDHLDWVLWWSLIEELDRLQAVEAVQ